MSVDGFVGMRWKNNQQSGIGQKKVTFEKQFAWDALSERNSNALLE